MVPRIREDRPPRARVYRARVLGASGDGRREGASAPGLSRAEARLLPDEASFHNLVAARLGYNPFVADSADVVQVELARDRGRLRGRAEVTRSSRPPSSARELEGEPNQCEALGAELATTLAIILESGGRRGAASRCRRRLLQPSYPARPFTVSAPRGSTLAPALSAPDAEFALWHSGGRRLRGRRAIRHHRRRGGLRASSPRVLARARGTRRNHDRTGPRRFGRSPRGDDPVGGGLAVRAPRALVGMRIGPRRGVPGLRAGRRAPEPRHQHLRVRRREGRFYRSRSPGFSRSGPPSKVRCPSRERLS